MPKECDRWTDHVRKVVAIEMVADSERLGQLDLVVLDD